MTDAIEIYLTNPQPAIHNQNLAGNKPRPGSKEQHRLGHILRRPVPPHRRLRRKSRRLFISRSPNSIQPGATQFTLTSGAKALAMACVSMCNAAFEAQ